MVWWMHPDGAAVATGSTIAAISDYANKGVTITQGTASKQPVRGVKSGVPCFAFDGVNDSMSTSATNLTAYQALTIVVVEWRNNTTTAIELEFTTDESVSKTGFAAIGNLSGTANFCALFSGNVGYQIKTVTTAASPSTSWKAWVCVANKANAAASELKIFRSGSAVSTFSTNTTNENTNSFANASWYIGGRNNASDFLSGALAQVLVLSGPLDDTDAAYLSFFAAQSAGIA